MSDIMQVMEEAKAIMRQSGNRHQWADGYPSEVVIASDMEKHGGFVMEEEGRVVAYFAFLPSPESTYANIYDGAWIDDTLPYHVIHRIASVPNVHGIFKSIMDFCFSKERNIRIDTHRDNLIMQHNILKHGFTYCGIIYLASGDERLAYQKKEQLPQNHVEYHHEDKADGEADGAEVGVLTTGGFGNELLDNYVEHGSCGEGEHVREDGHE